MTLNYRTTTEHHESVEDLIRYAAHEFAASMLDFPASRISKLIRRAYRDGGPLAARDAVEAERSLRAWNRAHARRATAVARAEQSAADQRAYRVDAGYLDPTGATAARNVDAHRETPRAVAAVGGLDIASLTPILTRREVSHG